MKEKIIELLNCNVLDLDLISKSNNNVYKVNTDKYGTLYVKEYLNNSSHIDNELYLYDLLDKKYLKELIGSSINPKLAIFRELKGKTIDELNSIELDKYKDKIIDSVINFYEIIGSKKINNYGLLDDKLNGKYNSFKEFIIDRQTNTQNILKDYNLLNNLFTKIYEKYNSLIIEDNSLVPIDTNLKNIMLVDNDIKFIDPGELISGPKLIGYGDFVCHIYKTSLYDCFINKMNFNDDDLKRLRIYAIFSSLNILAFLKKLGINDLENVKPYGNNYTFFELIKEHINELEIR